MKSANKNIRFECHTDFFTVLTVFLFLLIFVYFYSLGNTGLIDVDEPRYAEAGREMLESGNWIVPYFNYVVRYDKPIFFYWLEAISMKVFGVSEFAARLPSTLTAMLCLGFVFYFVKTFYNYVASLLAVLILMTSFEFAALARFSVTDMTLTSFISCSLICFFLGYSQLLSSHRFYKLQITEFTWWYPLAFLFLGLGFLTKGPVTIILFGLVIVPFFWWIGQISFFFKNKSFWIGFILFLLIILPWYISVHIATAGEFTKIFFGMHNFSRYTGVVSGHKGSIFYFIPVILIGFLPWIFFLPQAINSIFKKGLKVLLVSPKTQLPWFCLWWFLIVFLFFSFSRTKLLTYVLSVFPALSIIVALWFDELLSKHLNNRGLVIGLGVFFLSTLALLLLCVFNFNLILPREVKDLGLDIQIVSFAFILFVGVSMAWASSHRDVSMTITIILFTFTLVYFCLIGFVLPKVDKYSQKTLRRFAISMPRDVEVATYQIIKPSLTFYSRRQIEKIDSLSKIQEKLNQPSRFAFVTKKKILNGYVPENSYSWGRDSRYVFFTNYPLK